MLPSSSAGLTSSINNFPTTSSSQSQLPRTLGGGNGNDSYTSASSSSSFSFLNSLIGGGGNGFGGAGSGYGGVGSGFGGAGPVYLGQSGFPTPTGLNYNNTMFNQGFMNQNFGPGLQIPPPPTFRPTYYGQSQFGQGQVPPMCASAEVTLPYFVPPMHMGFNQYFQPCSLNGYMMNQQPSSFWPQSYSTPANPAPFAGAATSQSQQPQQFQSTAPQTQLPTQARDEPQNRSPDIPAANIVASDGIGLIGPKPNCTQLDSSTTGDRSVPVQVPASTSTAGPAPSPESPPYVLTTPTPSVHADSPRTMSPYESDEDILDVVGGVTPADASISDDDDMTIGPLMYPLTPTPGKPNSYRVIRFDRSRPHEYQTDMSSLLEERSSSPESVILDRANETKKQGASEESQPKKRKYVRKIAPEKPQGRKKPKNLLRFAQPDTTTTGSVTRKEKPRKKGSSTNMMARNNASKTKKKGISKPKRHTLWFKNFDVPSPSVPIPIGDITRNTDALKPAAAAALNAAILASTVSPGSACRKSLALGFTEAARSFVVPKIVDTDTNESGPSCSQNATKLPQAKKTDTGIKIKVGTPQNQEKNKTPTNSERTTTPVRRQHGMYLLDQEWRDYKDRESLSPSRKSTRPAAKKNCKCDDDHHN